MRVLAIVPLALLVNGCWTPAPGELNPARYPWDQPQLRQPPIQAKGAIAPILQARGGISEQFGPPASSCTMSLEQASPSGIGSSGTMQLGCAEVAPPKRQR